MPESKQPSIDEIMNAALNEVSPGAGDASVSDPPETEITAGADDEPIDGAEGAAADDGVDAAGEESTAADEEGDAAHEEVEPVAGEAESDAAAAAAAAAAAEPAKSEADKQREKETKALNDPIPKDVAAPTQERMRSLVKIGKEATQRAEAAQAQVNDIAGAMQSCGITPPQYKEWLEFMREFNSADSSVQVKALEKLEDMTERLSGLLGKERRSSDILANYPDIAQAVTAGQTTRKLAMEVAMQRRQTALHQQSQDFFRGEQQSAEQQAQERESVRVELNALDAQLMKSDPQFNAKKEMLVPQLKVIFKRLPVSQWKDAFLEAYRNTKVSTAGSALAATRRGVPAKQPLRGKTSSTSGARAPSSGLEAMNAALAGMVRK